MDNEKLKQAIEKRTKYVAKLSRTTGINERLLWNYVKGKCTPTLLNYMKLSVVLGHQLLPQDYLNNKEVEIWYEWMDSFEL